MGCGASDRQSEPGEGGGGGGEEGLLETYLRLERDIWQEERSPPAPALGLAMLRLSRLSGAVEVGLARLSEEEEEEEGPELGGRQLPVSLPDLVSQRREESEEEALRRVAAVLEVERNPSAAAEHEEFIANLNRKGMRKRRLEWLDKRKREAQEEVDRLTERVQHLQALYSHQQSLLRELDGDRQREEEAMEELERLRGYRDTLYSGELAWREAARLVGAAAALAKLASSAWAMVKEQQDDEKRWRLALESRRDMEDATFCVQAAQQALPSVQFPYCTNREIVTISQILEYILTDVWIPERYSHGVQVYNAFAKRSAALHQWIVKTLEESIAKDRRETEERFASLSTRLTNLRLAKLRRAVGLGRDKSVRREALGEDDLRKMMPRDLEEESQVLEQRGMAWRQ